MVGLRRLAALTLLVTVAFVIYAAVGLPPPDRIEAAAGDLVQAYGYSVLFAAALIESMFLIGLVFPGTTILVVGVALGPSQGLLLPLCALAMGSGGMLGYACDYAAGRLGWYVLLGPHRDPMWNRAQRWVQSRGAFSLLLATAHPTFGAPACVSAGVLGMPPLRFALAMVGSTAVWAFAWSALLFALGAAAQSRFGSFLSLGWLVPLLALMLVFAFVRYLLQQRRR